MELVSNLQPKQIEAARYWLDNSTEEILYGGAKGGAKSYLGCNLIFSDALTYPGTHYFIARHNLTDLKKFTHPSIYEVFEHWGIDPLDYMRFNGQENYFDLYNKSRVYYLDCRHLPSDPDFHRFGSMQFTRGWCEEIGQISDKAITNLSASIGRWKNEKYGLNRKMLLTCNPNKGYAYREFYKPNKENKLPDYRKYIKSLPSDNKYLTKEYHNALDRLPKNDRLRLKLGVWEYDDDPNRLVEYDNIIDLWTNNHVEQGKKYIICDVARFGKDRTTIFIWDGWRVVDIKVIPKSDLTHVRDVINSMKLKHSVPMSHIYIDEQGVGGGLVDMLPGSKGFIANHKPVATNLRENFDNIKSQCGFRLAEKINKAEIWIMTSDHKELIIEEIEVLKQQATDDDGKKKLIPKESKDRSKETMKGLLNRSPDFLDALIMRMKPELSDINYF